MNLLIFNALSWEQRKVGEVIEDYVEKTTVQNQYPVLTSSQQQGIVLQEDYFADRQVTTNDNVGYYVLPRGYFTYRSRSDTNLFVFNRNNLIDKGIISYYYPVFRPKNVDSNFLLRRLNNGIRSQVSMAAEGTGQHVLAHSKLKNMEFLVPSVPEQKLIGAYFEILDRLITLHQSKAESWKNKKSQLSTISWEQRKLGDIVERVTRKNTNLESDLPLTISAQYGLIDQNEFFDKRVASKDVSGYYLVNNGEFAYNKSTSNDAPWGAVKRLDRYEKGVVSTLYIVFGIRDSHQTDSDFLATYYDTNRWYSGVQAVAAEGARNHGLLNIAASDFFDTTLMLPASIEEQQRIGAFFKSLDNAITLHHRKLNRTQICIKRSFLYGSF